MEKTIEKPIYIISVNALREVIVQSAMHDVVGKCNSVAYDKVIELSKVAADAYYPAMIKDGGKDYAAGVEAAKAAVLEVADLRNYSTKAVLVAIEEAEEHFEDPEFYPCTLAQWPEIRANL